MPYVSWSWHGSKGTVKGMKIPSTHTLRVSVRSGSVMVTAEQRDDIVVEGGEIIVEEIAGNSIVTVSGHSNSIEARVPEGTTVIIGTSSGSTRVEGRAGRTVVATRSGKVEVAIATEVDIRVRSGSVRVGDCHGGCCINCRSGNVQVESAGTVDVTTASGRIAVGAAHGDVKVRAASGNIDVSLNGAHDVDIESIAGSVKIRVPVDLGVHLQAEHRSGRIENRAIDGDDITIRVKTVSGKITVDTE